MDIQAITELRVRAANYCQRWRGFIENKARLAMDEDVREVLDTEEFMATLARRVDEAVIEDRPATNAELDALISREGAKALTEYRWQQHERSKSEDYWRDYTKGAAKPESNPPRALDLDDLRTMTFNELDRKIIELWGKGLGLPAITRTLRAADETVNYQRVKKRWSLWRQQMQQRAGR